MSIWISSNQNSVNMNLQLPSMACINKRPFYIEANFWKHFEILDLGIWFTEWTCTVFCYLGPEGHRTGCDLLRRIFSQSATVSDIKTFFSFDLWPIAIYSVIRVTDKDVRFDFLSILVVNRTSDCIVGGFSAVGSGGKSGFGQERSTTKVTASLKRQLPWKLTQFSIGAVDTKGNVQVVQLSCALSTEEIDISSLK